jgi:hypothetical protein
MEDLTMPSTLSDSEEHMGSPFHNFMTASDFQRVNTSFTVDDVKGAGEEMSDLRSERTNCLGQSRQMLSKL